MTVWIILAVCAAVFVVGGFATHRAYRPGWYRRCRREVRALHHFRDRDWDR